MGLLFYLKVWKLESASFFFFFNQTSVENQIPITVNLSRGIRKFSLCPPAKIMPKNIMSPVYSDSYDQKISAYIVIASKFLFWLS